MIISASRRTDIPAIYSEWFYNRIKEGFILVCNPFNYHQISRVNLSPDVIDGIVFWTKNPAPMLDKLSELKNYPYYFQFTLNAYGNDVEKNLPDKNDFLIPVFQKLSVKIGAGRVIWRYDPILISKKYTVEFHAENFEKLAKQLQGYTKKCIVSFIDFYRNTKKNFKETEIKALTEKGRLQLAEILSQIAHANGLEIDACAENIDLERFGISAARCVDVNLLERISGYSFNIAKDKLQRPACGCAESIDIGMYNTCTNGCKYCYANYNANIIGQNSLSHKPSSPLLTGNICEADIITNRKMKSCRDGQLHLLTNQPY